MTFRGKTWLQRQVCVTTICLYLSFESQPSNTTHYIIWHLFGLLWLIALRIHTTNVLQILLYRKPNLEPRQVRVFPFTRCVDKRGRMVNRIIKQNSMFSCHKPGGLATSKQARDIFLIISGKSVLPPSSALSYSLSAPPKSQSKLQGTPFGIYPWPLQVFQQHACVLSHFRPTLCDPMGCSPPGSSDHGILQTRILEWVAMPSTRASSQTRDQTHIATSPALAGRFLTINTTWKPFLTAKEHNHHLKQNVRFPFYFTDNLLSFFFSSPRSHENATRKINKSPETCCRET